MAFQPRLTLQDQSLRHNHTEIMYTLTKPININDLLAVGSDYKTMLLLEKAYWKYIDNYCPSVNCTFHKFLNGVFQIKGVTDHIIQISRYVGEYDRVKRTIPTSGCVLLDSSRVLLVKVYRSPVYSFPKGKAEDGETALETAIRETYEETGIKVDKYNISATFTAMGTKMFVFFVNTQTVKVHTRGFNEIPSISWTSINDIVDYPYMYSKLTCAGIKLLINHKLVKHVPQKICNEV